MLAAPLPDSLLASMEAMAEPVDVAVAAVTPHRTPSGPGVVEVMATTTSAAARLFFVSMDLHQVSPAANSESDEATPLLLGMLIKEGTTPDQLPSAPQQTPPGLMALAQPLPPVLLTPLARRGRTPPPVQVYSRCRPSSRAGAEVGETSASTSQPLSPAMAFILKLSKTPSALLPIPHISKGRNKVFPPPIDAPRRSRRIAGMDVEKPEVCPTHLKKRVMRALDLNVQDEKEHLDQQLLDDYAQRFCQHLMSSHSPIRGRWLPSLDGHQHRRTMLLGWWNV